MFGTIVFTHWAEDVPEWYTGVSRGAVVPGTNNGAESCIKHTRRDAGNVVGSIAETMAFILQHIETVSLNACTVQCVRRVDDSGMERAMPCNNVFGTDIIPFKIRGVFFRSYPDSFSVYN